MCTVMVLFDRWTKYYAKDYMITPAWTFWGVRHKIFGKPHEKNVSIIVLLKWFILRVGNLMKYATKYQSIMCNVAQSIIS